MGDPRISISSGLVLWDFLPTNFGGIKQIEEVWVHVVRLIEESDSNRPRVFRLCGSCVPTRALPV